VILVFIVLLAQRLIVIVFWHFNNLASLDDSKPVDLLQHLPGLFTIVTREVDEIGHTPQRDGRDVEEAVGELQLQGGVVLLFQPAEVFPLLSK